MLHYKVYGSGNPMVLVHGFPNDGSTWNPLLEALSTHYQLIVPDLPGAGKSDYVAELDVAKMALGIKEVLDYLQIKKALLVGHSMGGYTILEFAQNYPHMAFGLCLVHSLATGDDEEKKTARQKSIKLLQNGTEGKTTFLKAMADNLFAEKFKETHPEAVQQVVEQGMQLSAKALAAFYKAIMDRTDKNDFLKETNLPIQWIAGAENKATPMATALKEAALPKMASIKIYDEVGHMSMMECPERLASDILEFADFVYNQ